MIATEKEFCAMSIIERPTALFPAGSPVRTHQEEYAAFLTPVQRGLFVIHYERFQRQIEAVQRRQMPRRGNRPGGSAN